MPGGFPGTCGPSSRGNHGTNNTQVWFGALAESTVPGFRQPEIQPAYVFFLMVPVTPSGEQLNGSIFRFDGAYSLVPRGNGCLKYSGSVMSTSSTRRWRAASKCRRSIVVSAAECSSPFVGCPGCSTYWFRTPAE